MPIGIGEILSFAVPVISGLMGSDAATSAAQTQANATDRATATELQMFNQNRADVQPWTSGGQNALSTLLYGLGIGGPPTGTGNTAGTPGSPIQSGMFTQPFSMNQFFQDPSYKFITGQQEDAIMNQKSALGGVNSGNTLRSLTDYATGAASTNYQTSLGNWNDYINNLFTRIGGVSNTGANAAAGVAGIGTNVASTIGNNQIGAGNALAAGKIGSTNALTGGIGNILALLGKAGNDPAANDPSANNFGYGTGGGGYQPPAQDVSMGYN